MKYLLLLLLISCGPNSAGRETVRQLPAAPTPRPTATTKPPAATGDRETTGPLDTLHVGRDSVLRLVPGSRNDFSTGPLPLPYTDARLIRQQRDGRVQRVGPTLVVRPFNGPVLRFTDNYVPDAA